MFFDHRVFTLPKDPEHPAEFQDAFGLDAARGVAVVADGVTSTLFSGQWAALLAEAVVAAPPDPSDAETFPAWLRGLRARWNASVEVGGLAWFQKAKLPLGAFSTLLWVQLTAKEDDPESYALRAFAVGDSCLLHVRAGQLLRSFPLQQASGFQFDPVVLGSVDLNRDHLQQFSALQDECCRDDLLLLCTDAVAEWALRAYESGDAPPWDAWWEITEDAWRDEVQALRTQSHMRYDDATLVQLRVGPPRQPAPAAAARPAVEEHEENVEVLVEPELVAAAEVLPEPEWTVKLKSLSDQAAHGIDEVSGQLIEQLKRLRDKAVQTYRETFGQQKKP